MLVVPNLTAFMDGFFKGAVPQIPLTLGNDVLATSLLTTDLLERKVPKKKIVTSIGLMCIISSPLGGFPMFHGAGGLAAQYRFGVRTGGSNIIFGLILLVIALFFGSENLVNIIPYGILGALLIFTAIQLSKSAFKTEKKTLTLITGLIALFTDMSIAFISMIIVHFIIKYYKKFK